MNTVQTVLLARGMGDKGTHAVCTAYEFELLHFSAGEEKKSNYTRMWRKGSTLYFVPSRWKCIGVHD